MGALAEAGFRACAIDLRGYGASDKPPGGHDLWTACADVSGVIRSLGADGAVVVGHGIGGAVAWSLPYLSPGVAWAVASMGMPHPRVFRRMLVRSPSQIRAHSYLAGLQRPWVPERALATDPSVVPEMLRRWAAPDGGWPSPEEARTYADAMTIPFAAHSAAEFHRWLVRSQFRRDGRRFARAVSGPVGVPVLQVRGEHDRTVPIEALGASVPYADGGSRTIVVRGAGHFAHEEQPARVNKVLLDWLDALA